jgi:hypothetical protein
VHVTIVLVVAAVIVAAVFLTGCAAVPVWRVAGVAGTGSQIAVSCYQVGGSGRRVFVLPASRARSVHVGDVCPS